MITSRRIDEALLRLREFFQEHAGTSVSIAQAAEVAELDRDTCEAILSALVHVRFVRRCGGGEFVRNAEAAPLPSANRLRAL